MVAHGKMKFVVRDSSNVLKCLYFCIFRVRITLEILSDVSPPEKKIFPEK